MVVLRAVTEADSSAWSHHRLVLAARNGTFDRGGSAFLAQVGAFGTVVALHVAMRRLGEAP